MRCHRRQGKSHVSTKWQFEYLVKLQEHRTYINLCHLHAIDYNCDIIVLSGIWLKNGNTLNYVKIFLIHFQILKPLIKNGGGVKDTIKSYKIISNINEKEPIFEHHLLVELDSKNSKQLGLFRVIYQPNFELNMRKNWLTKFDYLIFRILSIGLSNIVIMEIST